MVERDKGEDLERRTVDEMRANLYGGSGRGARTPTLTPPTPVVTRAAIPFLEDEVRK